MGSFDQRHRTEAELTKIFQTCIMRDCVTLSNGMIFFCSRQTAAFETDFYPTPLEKEFVNVRAGDDICKKLEEFYKLPYISTCDYCDGISCATQKTVPTAQQILDKRTFLNLLSLYSEFTTQDYSDIGKITAVTQLMQSIMNNIQELYGFESIVKIIEISKDTHHLADNWNMVLYYFLCFLNDLTEDYNYDIRIDSPYACSSLQKNVSSFSNKISVNDHPDSSADILIEQQEFIDVVNKKWPIDSYVYNRLFISSKLDKIKRSP